MGGIKDTVGTGPTKNSSVIEINVEASKDGTLKAGVRFDAK